jgi:hypothetical protein
MRALLIALLIALAPTSAVASPACELAKQKLMEYSYAAMHAAEYSAYVGAQYETPACGALMKKWGYTADQYERAGKVAPDAEGVPLFKCLHFMERGISSETAATEAHSAAMAAKSVVNELCAGEQP